MELKLFTDIAFIQQMKDSVSDVIQSIKNLAADLNVAEGLLFVVGAVLALVVGLFGYRLLKLVSAVGMGVVGFGVGSALFDFLMLQGILPELPGFIAYILGAVLALVFAFLGYKKFTYALFYGAFSIISGFVWGLTGDATIAMGLGLLLAIIAILIVRVATVLLTSFVGSFLVIGFAGQMLTDLIDINIASANSDLGLLIALGLGAIFTLLQFLFSRFYKAQ